MSADIGRSPSPTHSSDYVEDEEEDVDNEITSNTAVMNGKINSNADPALTANNLKLKRNSHSTNIAKASTVSYQKASVHNVRKFLRFTSVKSL